MTQIHPASQAEADRVFSPSDREAAAKRNLPRLSSVKQRYYRAGKKASQAIESWFAKTGSAEDLLDYERAAERQQLIALELHGVEALQRGLSK